jgi:hypothetical protein
MKEVSLVVIYDSHNRREFLNIDGARSRIHGGQYCGKKGGISLSTCAGEEDCIRDGAWQAFSHTKRASLLHLCVTSDGWHEK